MGCNLRAVAGSGYSLAKLISVCNFCVFGGCFLIYKDKYLQWLFIVFCGYLFEKEKNKFLFVETCRILLCYRDEKDFFDILRITALKLTNIEYYTLKEFHIVFRT